eukprot:gnl/TRDRNA2_/TRDRNA2_161871_c0_seq1.p1 gnl/TRDRNA2_/TRDRNA2_161871_c0~~gnl/TRDRNA2_/TRDRNA2_161871_c0_seq1.p1  ORF type:complete len:145 (+),score=31.18 gnl/TRDRNA2_/TRDRNA2_161871_c0_seq1:112-546(+)
MKINRKSSATTLEVAAAELAQAVAAVAASVASGGVTILTAMVTDRIKVSLLNDTETESIREHEAEKTTLALLVVQVDKTMKQVKGRCACFSGDLYELRIDGEVCYIEAVNEESFEIFIKVVTVEAENVLRTLLEQGAQHNDSER